MANIFLDKNVKNYILSNNDDNIYGTHGSDGESVSVRNKLNSDFTYTQSKNLTIDSNIELVNFEGNSSDYLFSQSGNILKVYDKSEVLIANIVVDDDGSKIKFSDTDNIDIQLGNFGGTYYGYDMKIGSAILSSVNRSSLNPIDFSLPKVALTEDNGISDSDGITNNYNLDIQVPLGISNYQYFNNVSQEWKDVQSWWTNFYVYSVGNGSIDATDRLEYETGDIKFRYFDSVLEEYVEFSNEQKFVFDTQNKFSYNVSKPDEISVTLFDSEQVVYLENLDGEKIEDFFTFKEKDDFGRDVYTISLSAKDEITSGNIFIEDTAGNKDTFSSIHSGVHYFGTINDDDEIIGTDGIDAIYGFEGNDTYTTGSGNDYIYFLDIANIGEDTVTDFQTVEPNGEVEFYDTFIFSSSNLNTIIGEEIFGWTNYIEDISAFISVNTIDREGNATFTASDKKGTFIFDTNDNKLYFDTNGDTAYTDDGSTGYTGNSEDILIVEVIGDNVNPMDLEFIL